MSVCGFISFILSRMLSRMRCETLKNTTFYVKISAVFLNMFYVEMLYIIYIRTRRIKDEEEQLRTEGKLKTGNGVPADFCDAFYIRRYECVCIAGRPE